MLNLKQSIPFQKEGESLAEWASQCIADEQQKPAVRYLLEWLLALLTINHNCYHKFFAFCDKGVKTRPGCVASYLTSLNLMSQSVTSDSFFRKAVEFSLQWCMGQHFNARLYAHGCLISLWKRIESLDLKNIKTEFQSVVKNIKFPVDQQRTVANAENLQKDFFFTVFHPTENLNFEDIFTQLPRLSQFPCDEWIPCELITNELPEHYQTQNVQTFPSCIPFNCTSSNTPLAEYNPADWINKTTSAIAKTVPIFPPPNFLHVNNISNNDTTNIQKKVVPWSSLSKKLKLEALDDSQQVSLFYFNHKYYYNS